MHLSLSLSLSQCVMPMTTILSLPPELLHAIASFLDTPIIHFAASCRSIARVFDEKQKLRNISLKSCAQAMTPILSSFLLNDPRLIRYTRMDSSTTVSTNLECAQQHSESAGKPCAVCNMRMAIDSEIDVVPDTWKSAATEGGGIPKKQTQKTSFRFLNACHDWRSYRYMQASSAFRRLLLTDWMYAKSPSRMFSPYDLVASITEF